MIIYEWLFILSQQLNRHKRTHIVSYKLLFVIEVVLISEQITECRFGALYLNGQSLHHKSFCLIGESDETF